MDETPKSHLNDCTKDLAGSLLKLQMLKEKVRAAEEAMANAEKLRILSQEANAKLEAEKNILMESIVNEKQSAEKIQDRIEKLVSQKCDLEKTVQDIRKKIEKVAEDDGNLEERRLETEAEMDRLQQTLQGVNAEIKKVEKNMD